MKIGIVIRDFDSLANWELRIIQDIQQDPKLDLRLLIQHNQSSERIGKRAIPQSKNKNTANWNLIKFVLKVQLYIERKCFFKKINTVNKEGILNYLKTLPLLKTDSIYKNDTCNFITKDLEKIKEYNLDILLNQGEYYLQGDILKEVKHGIWSLVHSENLLNNQKLIGLWELIYSYHVIEVTLQQEDSMGNDVEIDRAYFSPHWSLVKTNDEILEGSVSLVLKNLRILSKGLNVFRELKPKSEVLYFQPNLKQVLKYYLGFYGTLVNKAFKDLSSYFLDEKYQRWTLFLGQGDFLEAKLSQLKPQKLPKDEFWADPFLFYHGEKCYVFFETYCYKAKKGKLSCGIIKNDGIINVVDILDLDYHLSYPFVFEEDGEIYLMPETLDNKRLEIYKCIDFPIKWELFTTAFEGEMVADPFLYQDKEMQKWLFINKKQIQSLPMNSELFIYKIDSVKLNVLQPHSQNPVIIDSRTGRNGGAIFSFNNETFRPSQRNVEGIYGRALNINKIKELTIDSYIEENTMVFEPNFQEGLMSMHHLHQIQNLFVFDAAFKRN